MIFLKSGKLFLGACFSYRRYSNVAGADNEFPGSVAVV